MATIEQRLRFILTGNVEAVRGLKTLSQEQKALIREFQQGNRTYDETRNALKEIARGYEDAEQSADSFRNGIKALRQEQDRLNQSQAAQQRFDRTSQQVGLAGDVQSNLGAASGLAGSIPGGGGAGQAIGVAGELVVLIEELPRLKTAIQGLPQAANAAGAALGVGGAGGLIGVLGIAAVAIGAVAVAFQQFQRTVEPARDSLRQLIDARASVAQQLPDLTTAEIDTQTQRNEIVREQNEILIAEYRASLEELSALQNLIGGGQIRNAIRDLEASNRQLSAESEALNRQRDNEIVRQNDARQASEETAQSFQNLARQAQDFSREAERAGQRTSRASRDIQRSFSSSSSSRGSGTTRRGGGGIVLGRRGGSLFGLDGAREELSDEQTAQAKQTNDELRRIYDQRRQLTIDFNNREAELARELRLRQTEDLERFVFDQDRLLARGSFTQAFERQEEKAFSQRQDGRRVQFEADQRARQLSQELGRLAQELRNTTVSIRVEPNNSQFIRATRAVSNSSRVRIAGVR